MKKIIAIATAITIAIIISTSFAIPASAERTNTVYKLETVIVSWKLEHDDYKVTCLDENGDLWEFYDEEPWNIGDIAIIQLYAFDDDYTHDEILDVEYCSSLELHELAYYILEVTGA